MSKPDEHLPPLNYSEPAEVERRAGDVIRVTRRRTAAGQCLDCTARFSSTAAAASHSRSARHKVECDYRTLFVFAPCELLDGVK